jgi:RNA polymerase sigma factor (TIGR02999 family)
VAADDARTDVTRVLDALERGEPQSARDLIPPVYAELRRLAQKRLAQEAPGQTLDATGLVHEAYLRLVADGAARPWANRRHFFGAAAEAMRRILIENARRRRTLKRGGNLERADLDPADLAASESDENLLALDEALDRLATRDPVKAELVQLRYFSGLTVAEAAQALDISTTTADRYWTFARAWLRREITGGHGASGNLL